LTTVCGSACSSPAAALCLDADLLLYVRKLRRLTTSQDPVPAAAAAAARQQQLRQCPSVLTNEVQSQGHFYTCKLCRLDKLTNLGPDG
jgi:hypothetical protein